MRRLENNDYIRAYKKFFGKKSVISTVEEIVFQNNQFGFYKVTIPNFTPEEIANNFSATLSKYNLDRFVDADKIKKLKNYLAVLVDFIISVYKKKLNGKSPLDKSSEVKEEGIMSDIILTIKRFPHCDLFKKYSKMTKILNNMEYKKGLKKINEIFDYMSKNKITYPEIYRLFFNN